MRLCFIVRRFPRSIVEPIVSGEVKNAYYLARGLHKRGHDIVVFTDGPHVWNGNVDGIRVYVVGPGLTKGVPRLLSVDFRIFVNFRRVHRVQPFDIIHAHIASPLISKWRFLSTHLPPLVTTAHGTGTPEFRTQIAEMKQPSKFFKILNNRLMHYMDRYSWRKSDLVISAGSSQVEEMIKEYGVLSQKITPISNGVDTSFYRPSRKLRQLFRQKYKVDENEVILFVGRLTRKKGLQVLTEAAKLILAEKPDVVFFVVGGTDYFADYESRIRALLLDEQLGLKFVIVKNVPERDMPGFYNMADVCVVPSIEYEPLPTVVFEAMATGNPVIGSKLGGIPAQVGCEEMLVEPNQPNKLASLLIEVLNDNERRARCIKENRKRMLNMFSIDDVVGKHIEAYSRLKDLKTAP